MKTRLFLFLSLFLALNLTAQDAYYNMVKASGNISDAAEAFNLKNLKYHAKIAKAANEVAISELKSTDCANVQDLSVSIAIHLETALVETDFATAKAHMITSKDLLVKLFYQYDVCSTKTNDETITESDDDLSDLEKQQKLLQEQQAELERKNKEIQQKLAEQKLKEAEELKNQFITKNKSAISQNVINYNTSLQLCNCKNENINVVYEKDLSALDMGALKTFFLEKAIKVSENYISLLKDCKSEQ